MQHHSKIHWYNLILLEEAENIGELFSLPLLSEKKVLFSTQ